MTFKTYSADEVAADLGCRARWLLDQVRGGKLPGRKIARAWRFTDDDVNEILTLCSNNFRNFESAPPSHSDPVLPSATGLTATSLRRVAGERRQNGHRRSASRSS